MDNEQMEVVITKRESYGTERFYPHCAKSQVFARLAHRQTFSRRELLMIRQLGYRITIKQDEVVL
jgi:hypothetical protein